MGGVAMQDPRVDFGDILSIENYVADMNRPLKSAYPGKRSIDIFIATAAILAVWPVLVCIAALIWLRDGGPVIYRHTRIGRNGRPFPCLKFRTMVKNSDQVLAELLASDSAAREEWKASRKLQNDPRIIPGIGSFLRKTSLDELPQIVNILRGEMSLVGPRPVTAAELEQYGSDVGAYLSMRPGLTGPWQVSGRNDTSYDDRVRLDATYAAENSILTDLWILLTTVPVVVARRGAYVLAAAVTAQSWPAIGDLGLGSMV